MTYLSNSFFKPHAYHRVSIIKDGHEHVQQQEGRRTHEQDEADWSQDPLSCLKFVEIKVTQHDLKQRLG